MKKEKKNFPFFISPYEEGKILYAWNMNFSARHSVRSTWFPVYLGRENTDFWVLIGVEGGSNFAVFL
ncbi:MAG: hypothetical protein J6T94_09395 [Bacteroidaceae bacterium]|nr:hypothetical protein [Bacteroidaceae bacterium]